MAYCPKCGAKIADGSAFCSSCGFKIESDNTSIQPSNNGNMNDQNAAVNRPLNLDQVRAADEVIRRAFVYVDAANALERNPRFKESKKWMWWFMYIFEVPIITALVVALFNHIFEDTFFEGPAAIIGLVLGAFCGVVLVRWLIKFDQKKHNEIMEKYLGNLNEAVTILDENESVLSCIPNSYRYPLASGFILQIFQEGRVTTMSEALDKYDEQLHRWKVEATYNDMYERYLYQSARLF